VAKKRKKSDPLVSALENALDLGEFISYNRSWDFVRDLEDVKHKIDALVKDGQAERAVRLYELFLSGCYEKADEIDDSGGNLGMFFEDLFCAWINARQKAKYDLEETVQNILKWMDNDNYGFCYEIERDMVKVLNKESVKLFEAAILSRFEKAFSTVLQKNNKRVSDYSWDVRKNVSILKVIYVELKDTNAYLALCEKTGTTPKDCENIANLYKVKRKYQDALSWIEKGLKLEKEGNWGNQSSFGLTGLQQDLLNKLGRREDAFSLAWAEFIRHPSNFSYENLMKFVGKKDVKHWHQKALEKAKDTSLSGFIDICIKTKEWEKLSEHISSTDAKQLEELSHYTTEKAAKGLAKKHGLAAAKIYSALGMRILKKGKSKYYRYALEHFSKVQKLYEKAGRDQLWMDLVERVRRNHSRKYSFIPDFEKIVAGRPQKKPESFETRTLKRWKKQIT
jgi:tetratricopeptide (TPR) repeat protein